MENEIGRKRLKKDFQREFSSFLHLLLRGLGRRKNMLMSKSFSNNHKLFSIEFVFIIVDKRGNMQI